MNGQLVRLVEPIGSQTKIGYVQKNISNRPLSHPTGSAVGPYIKNTEPRCSVKIIENAKNKSLMAGVNDMLTPLDSHKNYLGLVYSV